MAKKMLTPPIDQLLGFDVDGRPGNIVLVFKDGKGVEYGVQLTPNGLNRTIVLAMQAFVELRKQSQTPTGHNIPAFAEYNLTGCKHFLGEDGRASLALQLDGLLEIAFPVTKPEAELISKECYAAIALLEESKTKGPPKQ